MKFSSTSTVLTMVTPSRVSAADHPVKRFAKIGAEAGGQRHLEADQRVDDQPLAADFFDRVDDLVHRLIHGEVQRPQVDELERAVFRGLVEVEAEHGGPLHVLGGQLLEDGDDARLAAAADPRR